MEEFPSAQIREAPASQFMGKYYGSIAVCLFAFVIVTSVAAVAATAVTSSIVAVAAFIAVAVGFALMLSAAPWARIIGEERRIAADVLAHSLPQQGPVRLDVWFPKATILQVWPEGSVVVFDGFVTVTAEGDTLLSAPVDTVKVKRVLKGIRLTSGSNKVRFALSKPEGNFMFRAMEFYAYRIEELKAALAGRQPTWIVFPTTVMATPTYPLRSQQDAHAAHATQSTVSQVFPHQAPAGWHPDPYGAARLRWWDGQQWSDHTAP
jgi:hypothetical protein